MPECPALPARDAARDLRPREKLGLFRSVHLLPRRPDASRRDWAMRVPLVEHAATRGRWRELLCWTR